MCATFNRGDTVAYTAAFCRSIGDYTDTPHWRGTVICSKTFPGMHGRTVVLVHWGDGLLMRVVDSNLAHVGPNLRFADPIYRERS